jgi:hypothetical protein
MRHTIAIFAALLATAVVGSQARADPPPITIDVSSPVEAVDGAGADVTYDVKSHIDADVSCTPAGGPGQQFSVTWHFGLGNSEISCTDGTNTATAGVLVQDTTPPVISPQGDIAETTPDSAGTVVNWTISATVDGSVPVSCTPASGSVFSLGTTPVSCSAVDSHGNSANRGFSVTVTRSDTEAPTLNLAPTTQTLEATGPGGAGATYTVSASDDTGNPTVSCDHVSGSTFPLGTTMVTCTATDGAGKQTSQSITVTVQDTTDPSLSLPANQSLEATSSGGATFTYSASATDIVDGSIGASCNPASGSVFPVGSTTVNCTATDSHGNSSSGSFTVTVALVDHQAPTFSGVPATIQREANGPLGSTVTYAPPTASDNLDSGPLLVTCLPASGATFALGVTSVSCTATDSHFNTGVATFSVVVVDTTPPVLTPPGGRNVYATTPTGTPRDNPALSPFLNGGAAIDIVDGTLPIANDTPEFLPVGPTTVTFSTTDDSGNSARATSTITVFPMPPAGTTPPPLPQPAGRTPPDDVKNLKAAAGSRKVTLTWTKPAATDFDHVTVTRALAGGGDTILRYTGKAVTFADSPLQNGVEYRYTVVAYDTDGNRSAGAVVTAVPKQSLLLSPRDGARVKATKKGLKVSWARMQSADYYNLQLYRVPDLLNRSLRPAGAVADVKILSVWPKKTSFVLKPTWKFSGGRYRLRPGVYRWYVWPGFGARAEVDYGPLLGTSSFVVIR